LKILFVASEVVPFAKTGGLADVAAALPAALKNKGEDVRIITPLYKKIDRAKIGLKDTGKRISVSFKGRTITGGLLETVSGDVPVYFLEQEELYGRDELYGTAQGDYPDNAARFGFLCRGVFEACKALDFKPDVFHCHDWQTGLIPVYLKTIYRNDFPDSLAVHTIHNIAYQGAFPPDTAGFLGVPADIVMHFGAVNFLKAAISSADIVTSVSERYIQEIQTPEFGAGLDGVLKSRSKDLVGIVNGLDYNIWSPSTDNYLPVRYDSDSLDNKAKCKQSLLEEKGLNTSENRLLAGFVGRLAEQKGIDIIVNALDRVLNIGCNFILLGKGDARYQDMLAAVSGRQPGRISVNLAFDDPLAHRIYAASDVFLMPSRFEPCGLGQMISMAYGTAPIVNPVGGFVDTVQNYDSNTKQGTGFAMTNATPDGLVDAIARAHMLWLNKDDWCKFQRVLMNQNFSWESSSQKYLEIYRRKSLS